MVMKYLIFYIRKELVRYQYLNLKVLNIIKSQYVKKYSLEKPPYL